MTKKRIIQVHIVAGLVIACLIGWIIVLYSEKHEAEKKQENDILTMYNIQLTKLSVPLSKFEEASTFDDQFSCLQVIADELRLFSAHLDMVGMLGKAGTWPLYSEVEGIAVVLMEGGTYNGLWIASFAEDGKISQEETQVILLLKEETEKLLGDMIAFEEDGVTYQYVLSCEEVHERLWEIIEDVDSQLIQINQ